MQESQSLKSPRERNHTAAGKKGLGIRVNESALGAYYRESLEDLQNFAAHLTGDLEAAQDIVQQAFIKTLMAIRQGDGPSNLPRWFNRVIRNMACDHRNSARVQLNTSLKEEICVDSSPELSALADMRDRCTLILDALNELSDRQRAAVLLTAVHGYDYKETASILGTTTSSIRQSLYRARQVIRAAVEAGRKTTQALLPLLPFRSNKDSGSGYFARIRSFVEVRLGGKWATAAQPTLSERVLQAVQPVAVVFMAALVAAPLIILGGGTGEEIDRPASDHAGRGALLNDLRPSGDTAHGRTASDSPRRDPAAQHSQDSTSTSRQGNSAGDYQRAKGHLPATAVTDGSGLYGPLSAGKSRRVKPSGGETIDKNGADDVERNYEPDLLDRSSLTVPMSSSNGQGQSSTQMSPSESEPQPDSDAQQSVEPEHEPSTELSTGNDPLPSNSAENELK